MPEAVANPGRPRPTRELIIITTSFPISSDGSEAAGSFVLDVASALADRVSLSVVAPGSTAGRERWSDGFDVFRYAAPAQPLSTLKLWRPRDMAHIAKVLRGGALAVEQAVTNAAAPHLLALWALPSGEWARLAAARHGLPYSIWALGSDIWTLGKLPWVRGRLRRVLQEAHTLYADGLRLADDTRAIARRPVGFLPSSRSIAAADGKTPAPAPPYRLLFLGRWHRNKGVDLLLKALEELGPDDWKHIAEVEIAGGGPMGAHVRRRVAALRARGFPIVVGGFLDKPAATAAIQRCDWVLIPSRVESIPVIYSDAMKMGRPVIAMPVGDLKRLVTDHATGVCAKSVSVPAYAAAIQQALRQSPGNYCEALASMARQFSVTETIVPQIVELVASGRC